MAKRAEVSDCVMQRFLALRDIQKAHNGRALANVEAIFEAMGHKVMPIPLGIAPVVQQMVDDYYARQHSQRIDKKDPHGPAADT